MDFDDSPYMMITLIKESIFFVIVCHTKNTKYPNPATITIGNPNSDTIRVTNNRLQNEARPPEKKTNKLPLAGESATNSLGQLQQSPDLRLVLVK